MEATYITSEYDHINKNRILTYEYRGCRYEVIDFGWKGGESLAWQHKNEQAHIDEALDSKKAHNPDFIPEHAQAGLDMFFEYVNS